MVWDYWFWIICSVSISVGIFLLTLIILLILLVENKSIFYALVSQLLNIERCFIDAHHNIISKNDKLHVSPEMIQGMVFSAASQYLMPTPDVSDRNRNSPDSQISDKKNDQTNAVENASRKTSLEMEEKAFEMPESDSEHVREVLNIYGRYISLHKKETLFFLITLTTIIISGALIAAFNSLFLATSSVYRDGPCPSIGPMDCFCGANHTYFSCDTGKIAAFPFDVHSGACFRWIARDITTSDVTTQLGVTTGLLVAFGSIAQAIIRIYLLAFNKRLSIATGIHRIAAKTIGINRDTARTRFCCCNLCWHCSACNLSLFKHPSAVIIVTGIYIATPILMVPGVILLYYYEISVTSLTFVVLVVIATLCVLSIVWIMTQESESSSNIPGGWTDAKNLLQNATMNSKNIANGKVSSGKGFSIPV